MSFPRDIFRCSQHRENWLNCSNRLLMALIATKDNSVGKRACGHGCGASEAASRHQQLLDHQRFGSIVIHTDGHVTMPFRTPHVLIAQGSDDTTVQVLTFH